MPLFLRLIGPFCLAGFLFAQSTQAPPPAATPPQDTSSSPQQTSSSPRIPQAPQRNQAPPFRRWGLGVIGSYVYPFKMIKNASSTTTTATDSVTGESSAAGGGVASYFYLTKNLSLNLDFIYRRAGYTSIDAGTDALLTTHISRTRANYYDFPLLARYVSRYKVLHIPVFAEIGPTWRYVDQITTSTTLDTTSNSALTSTCCTEIPDRPAHRSVIGGTFGIGLRPRSDEFGIKIVPEIRYTRWLQSTFDSGPTRSDRNQAEVLLSITF